MKLKIAKFQKAYNKEKFNCSEVSLNNYIKSQASKDIKKKLSVCFVLLEEGLVKGYYTLSSSSIPLDSVPTKYAKRFPKSYHNIPVTLLGRLAVDDSLKGKGYGQSLLFDALKRSNEIAKESIASIAVIVDPINENAIDFYNNYGFVSIPDTGKMFLPMITIEKLIV